MGKRDTNQIKIKSIGLSLIGLFLCLVLWVGFARLPRPLFDLPYSGVLRAQGGELLSARIADDEQWRFPPLDSVPKRFEICLITFEDHKFYKHFGFRPTSLIRAAFKNLEAGKIVQGGSTLSMQTVRLAKRQREQSVWRKLNEISASIKLECLYSKKEILQFYSNHAPFGGNIMGLQAASWRYYARDAHLLSWAEAAALAVLPHAPSTVNPGKGRKELLDKRNRLLAKLWKQGHIDSIQYELSLLEPLPSKAEPLPKKARHLLQSLATEYGTNHAFNSTINFSTQQTAELIVDRHMQQMRLNYIQHAAVLVVDVDSREVKAYCGNVGQWGLSGNEVDLVKAKRSPGSLLKPFLYASAIDQGLIMPKQLLPDLPIQFKGFSPQNFDKVFRGTVSADKALASSLNLPFVHLLHQMGYERFYQLLKDLNCYELDKSPGHYGMSIILGGAEFSLWELTRLYTGLFRMGIEEKKRPFGKPYGSLDFAAPKLIKREEEKEDFDDHGVIGVNAALLTAEALRLPVRPHEETGWEFFENANQIAWKTGTSQGFRDAWAIGFNGRYLVSVWVGNASGEGRPDLSGIKAAAPLLFTLFNHLPSETWNVELHGENLPCCPESGLLVGPYCGDTIYYQLELPKHGMKTCHYHQKIWLNEKGERVLPACETPKSEAFILVLPPAMARYFRKWNPNYIDLPKWSNACSTNHFKQMEMIYPKQEARVFIPKEQNGDLGKVVLEAAHAQRDAIVYWHLNGNYLGSTQNIHQMAIQPKPGKYLLLLMDGDGNELQTVLEIL